MSYGLRRYETLHRIWWFVFFILCLFLARYSHSSINVPRQAPELRDLGNVSFWTGLQGITITSAGPENSKMKQDQPDKGPKPQAGKPTGADKAKRPSEASAGQNDSRDHIELLSGVLLFIIRAGIIFLELRLLWLVIQYAARYMLQLFMSESKDPGPHKPEPGVTGPEALLPVMVLVARIKRSPLSFFLHPFIRLRLMLSDFQRNVSSEELLEKERRAVEADWRILYGSWGPYRCLFWVLPVLGLAQTALLLIAQFSSPSLALVPQKESIDIAKSMVNLTTQKEILDTVKPTFNLLLPLIQAAGVAVFFQVAATFLRYFEELYLSNLDAFIYDRLLSKLPLRSNDTLLILETLQKQFRDLNAALQRLENKVFPPTKTE